MARAALKWSLFDLARAAKVSPVTTVMFDAGVDVDAGSVAAMRRAFEAQHIRFMDRGALAGGILRSRIRYVGSKPHGAPSQQS